MFTFPSQIRYPDRTKFHAIFSLFLTKCSASREAVVSINFSVSSENQNNQIRMKKGKHSGITFCPDSYKNEKKNLHLVDIKEKWCLTFSNPRGGGEGGYYHIWLCAAVKGMVFKQFTLGYINRAFGSTIGYHFSGN